MNAEQRVMISENAKWPPCKCGGVAVSNASGELTRTCIRCGAIVRKAILGHASAVADAPSNQESHLWRT